MSRVVTILVLDAQPVSSIRKMIDGPDRLVVTTASPDLARHALTTMIVGVWICDVSLDGADLKSLIAIAEYTSPGIKILFVGARMDAVKATRLLEAGHGIGFLPRPFSPLDFKREVNAAMAAYFSDPRRKGRPTAGDDASGTRVLNLGQRLQAQESAAVGPDPDHYALTELLGVGGSGTVFLARDLFLDIDVAIKVINPDILLEADILQSLRDEARIAMQLSHPNIVRVYNFCVYNTCHYIVMELVRGQPLRDLIVENGALSVPTTCQILKSCADALEYAHMNNVTHNDLKPENIFITDAGDVKVIDFGTATLKNRLQELTHIIGTPEYISPEQLRCEITGPGTDIYALGIIAYLMLVGSFPFPAETTVDDFLQGVRPDFSALPGALAAVLEQATAYEAAFRHASVVDFVNAFVDASGCREVLAGYQQPIEIVSAVEADALSEAEAESAVAREA